MFASLAFYWAALSLDVFVSVGKKNLLGPPPSPPPIDDFVVEGFSREELARGFIYEIVFKRGR